MKVTRDKRLPPLRLSFLKVHAELHKRVCTCLGEICSCCFLAVKLGPASVLLDKDLQTFLWSSVQRSSGKEMIKKWLGAEQTSADGELVLVLCRLPAAVLGADDPPAARRHLQLKALVALHRSLLPHPVSESATYYPLI